MIMRKRVVFPAPLIPTIAAFSRSSILNEAFFIISSIPNDFDILLHAKTIFYTPCILQELPAVLPPINSLKASPSSFITYYSSPTIILTDMEIGITPSSAVNVILYSPSFSGVQIKLPLNVSKSAP